MRNYIIHAHSPILRSDAIAYVRGHYYLRFKTTPTESDTYFLAHNENGTITGSIALEYEKEDGRMGLEHIYAIDRSLIQLPLTRSNGAQFGRWIAEEPSVSFGLLYAASNYALLHMRPYGWLNHTDAVHRVLTRKGIVFLPIEATLILENVPYGDRTFYETPPFAKCYLMELVHVCATLSHILREPIETQAIIFK